MIPFINQSRFSMTKIDSAQNDEYCWCRGSPKLSESRLRLVSFGLRGLIMKRCDPILKTACKHWESFHFPLNKNFQRLHEVCVIAKFQSHSGHVTNSPRQQSDKQYILGGIFCMKTECKTTYLVWKTSSPRTPAVKVLVWIPTLQSRDFRQSSNRRHCSEDVYTSQLSQSFCKCPPPPLLLSHSSHSLHLLPLCLWPQGRPPSRPCEHLWFLLPPYSCNWSPDFYTY